MTSKEAIFVTGATGFIGTILSNELVKRRHTVHALSRETSNRKGLTHDHIRIVTGDIMNRDSLKRGMEGCTYVYHLAAYAKNWAQDPSIFFKQNVDGMRNVLEAAKEMGVRRIVIASTIVTFCPTPPSVVGDERMTRITQRCYTEYEKSKVVAEQEALQLAAQGYPVVIVNPTRVYGPGKMTEGNSVTLMIDKYDRGKLPILLDHGKNVGNYVLVDDLVQGLILAMGKGAVGERYILGGENVALKDFFNIIDELTNTKHRQINLPPRLALLCAGFEKKKAELFGWYPLITPGWVEVFLKDWAYSSDKARRELGYTITPLREGIRRTLEWLHHQRLKAA
jgi:nucleoside-diphosphate-sugar epimerase